MSEIDLETVRGLLREVLAERDRRVEEQRLEQERAEQEQLEEKSQLIERLGKDGYLALKYDDQPRGFDGRYRSR